MWSSTAAITSTASRSATTAASRCRTDRLMTTYLITGGIGFIGSNFILRLLREHADARVINLDKLTYAGNPANLRDIDGDERYRFVRGDICDGQPVHDLMQAADYVVHFAAETHVDRSLMEPGSFIQTDVFGTYTLLEAARQSGRLRRFLHISTDEVYGEVSSADAPSVETDPLNPRSPYAASKAGGEMQCRAYIETYGLPTIIARPANNVGPRQHIEKFVPLCITNALYDQPIPIYGDGQQVRDRLFVDDHCQALDLLLHKGEPAEGYNIGAGNQRPNLIVAELILNFSNSHVRRSVSSKIPTGITALSDLNLPRFQRPAWIPKHTSRQRMDGTWSGIFQNAG